MKFALYFANRGNFPGSLMAAARTETSEALAKLGIESLMLPENATRYGAVETPAEGRIYADFLKAHRGEYDGVVLVLPNFGDENGASEALADAGVPIFLLAYPDELGKMDIAHRRDAFCGKISIANVFSQFNIPYTVWPPHTMSPLDAEFAQSMRDFAAVCCIVKKLRRCRIGAIGARPTAFKTIRFDEVALQKHGITTETFDNSDLVLRVQSLHDNDPAVAQKITHFQSYADFSEVPGNRMLALAKTSIAFDQLIAEYELSAISLRCWKDMQQTLGIAPCVLLGELSDRGIPGVCEVDVCNAVSMLALQEASQSAATCLDWNNNYPGDPESCILFHCGTTAQSLRSRPGKVQENLLLGRECSFGCSTGFIKPMDFTFASLTTADGKLRYYSGNGAFDDRPLGEGYFGCAGVAKIPNLQKLLPELGRYGFRHHVSLAPGNVRRALDEALTRYLGYEKADI